MQEASEPQQKTLNIKEHPDLYHKSIKGGYWVILLRLMVNLLSFVKVYIIVNFFHLEDLGIISIALMMIEVLNTFTETGFNVALIQKKDNIRGYLDTAWTTGFIKGLVLFLVLFFAAPFLASIRVPEDKVDLTVMVLRVMAFCFLIQGMRNIGTIYFQKDLDFRKEFVLRLATSLSDVVLSIGFIFILRSIWAVIVARILTAGIGCVSSYMLSSYRPRIHFEADKVRNLWRYGKWIYGMNILGYCLGMGDNFFVWFSLGLPQLALYKAAFDFASMPSTHISQVISTVSFPAYCKIQDDLPRLRQAYLKILKITTLLSIPVSFLIFSIGPDFVKLFLKEHLHPMTAALQILALKGFLAAGGSTRGSLYKAMGKPNLDWHLQWMRVVIFVITIYPLTAMWGIVGTAISTCLVSLIVKPFGFWMAHKLLKCSLREHLMPSVYPLIASGFMLSSIAILKYLAFANEYILFFVSAVAGSAIYLVSLLLLDYYRSYNYREILLEQLHLIQKKIGL